MKKRPAGVMAVCLAVLFAAVLSPTAVLAATRTVVYDTFADGGTNNGPDALDVEWGSRVGPVTLTVENAELTPGGGNALKYSVSTQNRSAAATFPVVTLVKTGDWVRLDLVFRVTSGFTNGNLNIGLANTNGLGGYHMQLAALGGVNTGVYLEDTNSVQMSPKVTLTAFGATTHTVTVLLRRIADVDAGDGNTDDDIEFTFGSDLCTGSSLVRTDDTPSALAFNQIWFGNTGTGSGSTVVFDVDDVTVTTSVPLPPPTGSVVALR